MTTKAQEMLKFLDEKKGKSLGFVEGADYKVEFMLHPVKEYGGGKGTGEFIKTPGEIELVSALEDAAKNMFEVIHIYSDDEKKIKKIVKDIQSGKLWEV